MKYTSLKQDIISILSSTDSGLQLKMYDDEGNTTLQSDDVAWVYIFNKNIMIEMMDDENPILYFWKNRDTLDDNFKNIIQRIRELSILNGISVQIRVYDNLDQRKIYNLIKSSIETKAQQKEEEEEMVESVNSNNELVEAFTKIISSAKSANRPSDFYLSEEMKSQNTSNLLNEMFGEISNLKPLKSSSQQLSELFNRLMTATTRAEVDAILSETPSTLINKLSESVNYINNVSSFIRQKYENNIDYGNETNNEIILENVKVYKVKVNGKESSDTNFTKDGKYVIEVTDEYGNSSSVTFYIDKTAPKITGVKNKGKLKKATKIYFSDSYGIASAKLNNKSIKSETLVYKPGKYTLVVKDIAGNTKTIKFEVAKDKVKPTVNVKKNKTYKKPMRKFKFI